MKNPEHLFLRTVVFFVILVFSLSPNITASAEAQTYTVNVEEEVSASMRDGIRLFSSVYRPASQGKFPAILIRTPYNKSNYCEYSSFPVYAAQRGYVVIIQDVRGRYASEGEFLPYVQETNDGYDRIEWATALSYVNS